MACLVRNLAFLVVVTLLQLSKFKCEYFKSNEIPIDESFQVGAQIINLNKLLSTNYKYQGLTDGQGSFVFRLINDTKLGEYVELKRLDSSTSTSLVLKKPLDFDLICQPSRSRKSVRAERDTDALASCTQSLKIIRLNENDFIEIPVLISKAKKPLSLALSFGKSSAVFNLTKLKNVLAIDGASIMNAEDGIKPGLSDFEINQLSSRINYKLLKLKGLSLVSSKNAFKNASKFLNYNDFIKWSVQKLSSATSGLKLSIAFHNEQTFEKAIQLDLEFSFQLIAFIRAENNQNYYVVSSSSQNRTIRSIKGAKINLFFRIDKNDYELEKEKLSIKPLYFDRPIYSLVIDDKTDLNGTILHPKLSSHQYPQLDDIVFKILAPSSSSPSKNGSSSEEDDETGKLDNLPFQIDERTGAIRLKDGKDLESIVKRDDYEMAKLFTFDIKATYRKIDSTTRRPDDSSKAPDSLYSYYNYMIPALAKVEISLNLNENDETIPNIDFTVMAPWLANFKVVNTNPNKSNQTVVFFISQPIARNTTLLNVFLNSNDGRKSSSIDFKRFYWSFSGVDSSSFRYHFTSKPTHHFRITSNTNLELTDNDQSNFDFLNNLELRDQTTYRTSVKLVQKRAQSKLSRNQNASLKYSQINFEFRVDFQALAFERPVYFVVLNRFNLANQRLIHLSINQTADSPIRYSFVKRMDESVEFKNEYLYLDPTDGWLWIRKPIKSSYLLNRASFEYEIMAKNERSNKTSTSKLFIVMDCQVDPLQIHPLKLFSNNRVQLPVEVSHLNVNYLRSLILVATDFNELLQFSMFENSPSQTQVGRVVSVCEDSALGVKMHNSISIHVCLDEPSFINDETNCATFNLTKLIDGPLAFLKSRLQLFSLDAANNIISTNSQSIDKNTVLELIKSHYSSENRTGHGTGQMLDLKSLLDSDESRVSVIFDLLLELESEKSVKKFDTQVWLRDAPVVKNLHGSIYLAQQVNLSSGSTTTYPPEVKQYQLGGIHFPEDSDSDKCIFKYDFDLHEKMLDWSATRFVKVDSENSQVHQEAEYRTGDECYSSSAFVIRNDGCLTIRLLNASESDKCTANGSNVNSTGGQAARPRPALLQKGTYNLTFKLCYYEKNKIACSPLYQQLVTVVRDVTEPSELLVTFEDEDRNSSLSSKSNSYKSASPFSFSSRFSVYHAVFIGIFVALIAVVMVIIFSFAKLFGRKSKATHFTIEKSIISSKTNINHSPTGADSDISNYKSSGMKANRIEICNQRIQNIKVSDDFMLHNDSKEIYNDCQYDGNVNLNSNGSYNSLNSASGETSALFAKQLSNGSQQIDFGKHHVQLHSEAAHRHLPNGQHQLGPRKEFPRPDCIFQNDGHYFYSVKNAVIHQFTDDNNHYLSHVNVRNQLGLSQANLIDTNNLSRPIASYSNEMLLAKADDEAASVTHSSPSSSATGALAKPMTIQPASVAGKEKTVKQLKKESALRKNSTASSMSSQMVGSYPISDNVRPHESVLNYNYNRRDIDSGFDNLASSAINDQNSELVLCPNSVIASIV